MLTALIFCGGKGTRMRDYDKTLPKPLININGNPLISYIIKQYDKKVDNLVLLTGHKYKEFNKFRFGSKVSLLYTGENSSTLERLKKAKNVIKGEYFFLTYGDSYAKFDLLNALEAHKKTNNIISSSYFLLEFPYGKFINFKNNYKYVEKEEMKINSGFYICSIKIFKYLENFKSLERELIPYLIKKKKCSPLYPVKNWHPVDSYHDVLAFQKFLNKKK